MERYKFDDNGDNLKTSAVDNMIEYTINCFNYIQNNDDRELINGYCIVQKVIYFYHDIHSDTIRSFMEYVNCHTNIPVEYDPAYNSIIILKRK